MQVAQAHGVGAIAHRDEGVNLQPVLGVDQGLHLKLLEPHIVDVHGVPGPDGVETLGIGHHLGAPPEALPANACVPRVDVDEDVLVPEHHNEEQEEQDKEDQNKDQEKNEDQEKKDQEKKDQDKKDQDKKDQEKKDQEKQDQEKKDQQEQKDQEQKKDDQEGKENEEQKEGEQKEDPMEKLKEKLKEMNIPLEKAEMILEAMKNNETQYVQQKKRKATQKKDSSKPDW